MLLRSTYYMAKLSKGWRRAEMRLVSDHSQPFLSQTDVVVVRTVQIRDFHVFQTVNGLGNPFSVQVHVLVRLAVPQTTVAPAPERQHLSFLAQYARVNPTSHYFLAPAFDRLQQTGLRLVGLVLVGPALLVAQFTLVAGTPSVDRSVRSQSHAVGVLFAPSARHLDDLHITKFFYQFWLLFVLLAGVSELVKIARPPRISPSALSHRQTMRETCRNSRNTLSLDL